MIERVAWALNKVVHWETQTSGTREENMRAAAYAAIEAMNEPTQTMIMGSVKALDDSGRAGFTPVEWYRAMIDAALTGDLE